MLSIKESIKAWFGFTRRERRASFILLMIIATILILRSVLPDSTISLTELSLDFIEIPVAETIKFQSSINFKGEQVNRIFPKAQKTVLEINSCDSTDLESLPGIGKVLSARIIKYRNLIGGFVSVSQIKEVYGLPEETFKLIEARLTADSSAVKKIKINEAGFRDISRHPYFKRNEVTAILKYRELKGNISGVNEMVENNLISKETAGKVRGYLEF